MGAYNPMGGAELAGRGVRIRMENVPETAVWLGTTPFDYPFSHSTPSSPRNSHAKKNLIQLTAAFQANIKIPSVVASYSSTYEYPKDGSPASHASA